VKDWNGTFELVNPALIIIDRRYQRDERPQLVASISAHAAWEPFGVVICAKRVNGVLVALDGQQRLAGLLSTLNPPKRIPVIWFPVASIEEESRIFSIINEARKAVLPLEKHKARLVQKEPFAMAIARAAEKVGFSIGTGGQDPRTIKAIAALNWVYNEIGEEGLVQVLTVIRDAWPNENSATSPFILKGVSELVAEANGGFNRHRITSALAKHTAGSYIRKADELKFDVGGSKQSNIRRAFKVLAKV
jgi:hypothetical protein